MGPDPDAPVVVAGVGAAALPVTVAAIDAGCTVVRWVTGPHELPSDADRRAVRLAEAAAEKRLTVTADPQACAGFSVAVLTEAAEHDPDVDGVSPVEHYAAELAPHLRRECLLAVSSATAEHAGAVVDATVELLTGLRGGRDYALAHLFPPDAGGRLIVSGLDDPSVERAREWLDTLGLASMPVLPVAAAEVVATLLARADRPSSEDSAAKH